MLSNKTLNELCITVIEETKLKNVNFQPNEEFLTKIQDRNKFFNEIIFSDKDGLDPNNTSSLTNNTQVKRIDRCTIYLEEGTFYEDNFEVTAPVIIKGADYIDDKGEYVSKTIVKVETTGSTIAYCHDCKNVEMSNITFDRNSTSGIAVLFLGNNTNNSIVKQCKVTGTPGEAGTNQFCALEALNGATGVAFEENIIEGFHSGGYAAGIGFIFAGDIIVKNNKIDGLGSTANGVEGLIYGPCTFDGNIIKNCGCGIYQNQVHATIINNKCTGNVYGAALSDWHVWNTLLKDNYFKDSQIELYCTDGFDATKNYWGTTDPTHLVFEEGTPIIAPWYMDEDMTSLSLAVTEITVTSEGNVDTINGIGVTLAMHAEVLPLNPTVAGVTWSVENGTGSASINENGLLTSISAGTVIVKATAKDLSGVVGSKLITITNS